MGFSESGTALQRLCANSFLPMITVEPPTRPFTQDDIHGGGYLVAPHELYGHFMVRKLFQRLKDRGCFYIAALTLTLPAGATADVRRLMIQEADQLLSSPDFSCLLPPAVHNTEGTRAPRFSGC